MTMDDATENMEATRRLAAQVLKDIRASHPLVLSLTNTVSQAFTANALLAAGASPIMLADEWEAEELLRNGCGGLLVNVGTVSAAQACTITTAARTAQECNVPWVLDPVAAGLLSFRTTLCRELLKFHPAIIRGNPSEIMALAGEPSSSRGTESTVPANAAIDAAMRLARQTQATVLVTGEVDYVTYGADVHALHTGHPLMARVTGTGCALGALCAACLPCSANTLDAALAAACIMGEAGRRAALRATAPGSFAIALLDELAADLG